MSRQRILILRLSAIGDVVNALPVLTALRRRFPSAHIAWLVEDRAKDVVTGLPGLDEVFVFSRREWRRAGWARPFRALGGVLGLAARLRAGRFDLLLDLQGNLKSGLLGALAGARARIGFDAAHCREGNFLFTTCQVSPAAVKLLRAERHLSLLRGLGIETRPPMPSIALGQDEEGRASEFLAQNIRGSGPIVTIHPGSSEFGAFKRWPAASYAALADKLMRELDATVVVTWGPGEREIAQSVLQQMTRPGVLGPETRTIKDLAALLKRADMFIGGDTGPMHVASAMGTAVVAIFGPKDPAVYSPYGERHLIVRKDLPCSPCAKRRCDNPVCMTSVTPDDVFRAAQEGLRRWPRPEHAQIRNPKSEARSKSR